MASSIQYYPGYSQQQVSENLVTQTIASVTNSNPCVITTVNPHNYEAGMMATFLIPVYFGMIQLNIHTAQILAVTSNTLTVNLDSTNYTPFAYPNPLPSAYTPPTVVPVSSGPYLPPQPLPYGNNNSFEGVIYNNGAPGNPINGM